MPLPLTHALVPIAGAIAFSQRSVPWRLIIVAAAAAMVPDVDSLTRHFFGISDSSIYSHRGAAHSLFIAVAAGLLAAAFHRRFQVRYLTAAVVVAAAMASHGLLDMMTDSGKPVAYLWPLNATRLYADWRPIHTIEVHRSHLVAVTVNRIGSELLQVIAPMFVAAIAVRFVRIATKGAST